ncbi:hypothetical protein R6Q59_023838 [Mikania micrantha]
MDVTGPSPIVPFLIVNVLAIIILSPVVQNLVMIPVLVILIICLFSSVFPTKDDSEISYQYQSGSGHEGEGGFGFGDSSLQAMIHIHISLTVALILIPMGSDSGIYS